ncbi:MAG: threonine synthase [Tannerella sp.]|jgi:threonine synthase|nr:threonine synthase [Tannerella sp.]
MKYYSTNRRTPPAALEDVVIRSLAGDRGLYMPEQIPVLDSAVIRALKYKSFREIAFLVAEALFGDDMEADALADIVADTLSFETPVVHVRDSIYALELFHGPTLAFKDVGARFMARLLGYFIRRKGLGRTVNVLVATSGDTGSAVANGFFGVEGIRVFVLYPRGKVSPIQECQFTTQGGNITAIEIDGTFDDCQALVKEAFADRALNDFMLLTSANSINVARLLPQSFYYFNAYAQMDRMGKADHLVVSVPSGNFGNLSAGLFAAGMGLPVDRFIAANNRNDVFFSYLKSGKYVPRPSTATLANAMDVGNPSNFARILDLFGHDHAAIARRIAGHACDDEEIAGVIRRVFRDCRYLLDPHGACACRALEEFRLLPQQTGLFLETAHPAKFKDTIDRILNADIDIPDTLQAFMKGRKRRIPLSKDFGGFRAFLTDGNSRETKKRPAKSSF